MGLRHHRTPAATDGTLDSTDGTPAATTPVATATVGSTAVATPTPATILASTATMAAPIHSLPGSAHAANAHSERQVRHLRRLGIALLVALGAPTSVSQP